MPLQRDTVSISLAQTINQKVDDRVQGPNQMASIKDKYFNKDGQLVKRYGQTAQGQTIQTSFPNPLSFAANGKSTVFSHEDQLCLVNNGALYSQMQGQDKWIFKGHCMPVEAKVTNVNVGTTVLDVATVSGITVTLTGSTVFVKEDATGAQIAQNSVTNGLKLVAFSNAIWVLSNSGANLYATQVNLTTGALGSPVTLKANASTLTPSLVAVTLTSASSAIGEAAFIAYQTTALTDVSIFPLDSSGALLSLGAKTYALGGAPINFALYCEPSLNASKIYFAYSVDVTTTSDIKACAWTFTSSAYTSVFTAASAGSYTPNVEGVANVLSFVGLVINPVNDSELYIFFDVKTPTPGLLTYTDSSDSYLFYSVLSLTGTVTTTKATLGRGLRIAATPIRDAVRKTIYLPCVFFSPLQTTLLLLDVLKGKSTPAFFCVSKVLYGEAGLPSAPTSLRLVSGSTYRMANNGYVIDYNFLPSYAQNSAYFAKTTHLTGGLLWAYDGQTVSEHNFLMAPEITQAWAANAAVKVTVTQAGAAGVRQKWKLNFLPGKAYYSNATGSAAPYVEFNTTTTGYYIFWKVDGTGGDPARAGRTGIVVNILSTDTPEEIAVKTSMAVTSGTAGAIGLQALDYYGTDFVIFQNFTAGAVTPPTAGNMAYTGALSTGSYQYCAVLKWTDRNGNIYRSAPSVAKRVTASANDQAVFEVWAPALTNKSASVVTLEIYRSQANADTLQLLTSTALSDSSVRYWFFDTTSDADLADNEILYTTGGVMENYNIGACTAISKFKNRLMVTRSDDPTAVYYSRQNIVGEPVNFSAFNVLRYDADSLPVTAHAQMDDKLAVFKANSIYVTAGDGSNDLGQAESFQQPLQIPGDIGCVNPNSVIFCALGLMFQSYLKGIYALSRNLSVDYVGAPVDDYKTNQVASAVLAKNADHIVFGLQDSATALVYNYILNRWCLFTNHQGDSATLWQNKYVRVKNSGKVFVETTKFYDVDGTNQAIAPYAETPWLKVKNLQNFQRVYCIQLLGEYKSAHTVSFELLYDYVGSSSTAYTFDAATISTDPPYQIEVQPARQKCEAIKIKITETPGSGSQEGAIWNALDIEVGLKPGLNRVKAAKSI